MIPLAIVALIFHGDICGAQPARGEEHATAAAASPASAICQRSAFRVVVDVGHTLDIPGAISARGVPEYAFNLRLASEVREKLVAAGFAKTVLLITAEAPPLGLVQRTLRANALGADLFISIHHDSVPEYLLESWDYEGQPNHFSDRFKGFALFISNDNADRAGSLKFGQLLGRALEARGLSYTPHYTLALMTNRRRELLDAGAGVYRYDQLIVLRDTRMPAVLLEAGSIVNRDEELELGKAERRSLISAAVAAAVADFCAARSKRNGPPHAKAAPPGRASAAAR
jgi:N-acetylmuramoyl-L-alanine amidase